MFSQQDKLTPCGRTRREFLWQAGGGFAGTALAGMLSADGFFDTPAMAGEGPVASPLAAKQPHFTARAKSVIFLFMYGGPSQVDLWDPKPELVKRSGEVMPNLDNDPLFKVRNPGKLLGSTRTFTPAGESGIPVSDLFPHVANCVDDIAVIRSMYADSFAHGSGLLQMNTGFVRQGNPSCGSWINYGLGTSNQNLPGYVVLLDHRGGPITGPPNWSSGYMPATYQGTQFRTTGAPIVDLRSSIGLSQQRQRDQLDLIGMLNQRHQQQRPGESDLQSRIDSYELAFRMQQHAPEAVDMSAESAATQSLYGLDEKQTEKFGRRCLMARRLVERGVRFVQVYSGGGHSEQTWDAHSNVNKNHEEHCRNTDRPVAGLLQDLKRQGLLDETLVVWTGEFGRTPTAQNGKGRDHSPRGFSAWMAGGGIKGGQTIGATDEFGFAAVENKVHVHDLHATILHLLGLDHELLTYFHGGRDMRLTDVEGRVVRELLA
ncbi:hypothetical protein CA54_10640 [Symmachiella macrocystis]|uniref:Sulfatase n=1 Tax=Symmachiella macrocystis TaxID=2527985 RepID=A0A5C6BL99_9PLAN|nr:DUF1501 domain-containing protein [Symmachiella macrocystis]TWU12241.1 hypothetical protein CA54_10640 [Symmachiella macrocystis]